MPNNAIALTLLSPGESGIISGFEGIHGLTRQRLHEMGLLQGTRIRLVRRAPLGDPIQIHFKGYHLMLRNSEACGIYILREPIL